MSRFLALIALALPASLSAQPAPSFEQNNGQFPDAPSGSFVARSGQSRLILSPAGPVFVGPDGQRIPMLIPGARWSPPQPAQRLQRISNYFRPPRPITSVPHFRSVSYPRIFPGIDLLFYPNAANLEYDFLLHPNANPAQIRLRFPNASLRLENGQLLVQAANFQLKHLAPSAHQNGTPVRASLALSRQEVRFQLGPHNPSLPLTIDPVVEASTLIGSPSADTLTAVATDASGNLFAAGYNATDAFVRKFSPDAKTVLFTSYLGGSQAEILQSLAIDPAGNAVFGGRTFSADFPVTPGAFRTPPSINATNTSEAFLAKLNAAGTQLLFSTFFGGSNYDEIRSIALDAQANIFLTGNTRSSDFPLTPGSFRGFSAAFNASFIAKLDPSASTLLYSARSGGATFTRILLTPSGAALLAGTTSSTDLPTTPGVIKPVKTPGSNDIGYILKLSPSGATAEFATFFGGNYLDDLRDIATDAAGNIYLAGRTHSDDFPATNGTGTGSAGFLAKIDPAATTILYANRVPNNSGFNRIAVEPDGTTHAVANQYMDPLPAAPGLPLMANLKTAYPAAMLVRANPAGDLLDSTFWYGPSASTTGTALAVAAPGVVLLGGVTTAATFPVTTGSAQTAGTDGFLTRISYVSTCAYTVSQPTLTVPIGGGTTPFTVTTTPGCPWTASSSDDWIATTAVSDSQATVTVPPTSSAARSGYAFIAGKTIPVTQSANCVYSFQGQTRNFSAAGGIPFIGVTAGTGCPWSATVDQPWAVVLPGSYYPQIMEPGFVLFVEVNHTNTPRTATVTIAPGATLIIQQAANPCTFTVSPTSFQLYTTLTPLDVTIATGAGCSWNLAGHPTWIHTKTPIRPNVNSGPATVRYTADANPGAPRTGNILVAGQTVTVTQSAVIGNPPIVSNPGSTAFDGLQQTLVFRVTDADGFADISRLYFLIESGPAIPQNSCHGFYLPSTRALYLYNDDLSVLHGPLTLGTAGTLSNSQCAISGSASSIQSETGNAFTLLAGVTLSRGFLATPRKVFGWAQDRQANDTGWTQLSSWSYTVVAGQPPALVIPSLGTLTSPTSTISVHATDADGAANIQRLYFLVNSNTAIPPNTCHGFYDVALAAYYLYDDALGSLLGPLAPATNGSIGNSQCRINGASSLPPVLTAGDVRLNTSITLTGAYATRHQNVYFWVVDQQGLGTGWGQTQSWIYTAPVLSPTGAMTASPLPGRSRTVTVNWSAVDRPSAVTRVSFLLSPNPNSLTNVCYLTLDVAANSFTSSGAAQCTITAPTRTSANSLSTGVTLLVPYSAAVQNLYVRAQYDDGADSGWNWFGAWEPVLPPLSQPPVVTSVAPAAASAPAQVFTAVITDPDGPDDLNRVYFLVNTSTAIPANTCHGFYDRASNAVYLYNDALTNLSSLTNSQCTIVLISATTAGADLTLQFRLSLSAPFSNQTRNLYLWAVDKEDHGTGWVQSASWRGAAQPALLSATPVNPTSNTQTLTFLLRETDRLYFLINPSPSIPQNTCHGFYDRPSNTTFLYNDALTGPAPGLANSQCALSPAVASVNGTDLSVALTFSLTSITQKNFYIWAANSTTNGTGWLQTGSWALPFTPALPNWTRVYFLINPTPTIPQNTCHGFYDRAANAAFLYNDTLSSLSSLTNNQCAIEGFSLTGNTFNLYATRRGSYLTTAQNLYFLATDAQFNNTGWLQTASWTQ